jgi:hypothetical protein
LTLRPSFDGYWNGWAAIPVQPNPANQTTEKVQPKVQPDETAD